MIARTGRGGAGRLATALALALAGCGAGEPAGEGAAGLAEIHLDLEGMEPQVAERLRQARAVVEAEPDSASAWGGLGMVAHAHELWDAARTAYRFAEALDATDERWPYYLGDVLTVVGTEPDASAIAFRRAIELRRGYAPAHMRLGQALLAAGDVDRAGAELGTALELAPDLEPARVSLAQIRLSRGELAQAAELLETVLDAQPRNAQALSTLGQVYMRQGRRDEARAVAVRSRDAALYSLFSDPLMEPVVASGVSSLLVWERAKAFLDNGDDEQAVLGLQRVLELRPDNADAHQQLAIAYGNLGRLDRVVFHLARAADLLPERTDILVQLAVARLEARDGAAAIPTLERVLELDGSDPDAPWLLGRARLMGGDVAGALAVFEHASATAAEVPVWARNEWGSALAQSGMADAAMDQFQAALVSDPDDAQALFFIGLLLEARGEIDRAVAMHCRSQSVRAESPASQRLRALGRECPGGREPPIS